MCVLPLYSVAAVFAAYCPNSIFSSETRKCILSNNRHHRSIKTKAQRAVLSTSVESAVWILWQFLFGTDRPNESLNMTAHLRKKLYFLHVKKLSKITLNKF